MSGVAAGLALVPAVTSGPASSCEAAARAPSPSSAPPPHVHTIAATSDAIVVATLADVGEVRWNSADGEPWADPDLDAPTVPACYRLAALEGVEVVVGAVEAGRLHVVVPSSQRYEGVPSADEHGPGPAGEAVVVALDAFDLVLDDGSSRPALRPAWGPFGWWARRDGRAVNVHPDRSLPVDDLIERLRFERARTPLVVPTEVGIADWLAPV